MKDQRQFCDCPGLQRQHLQGCWQSKWRKDFFRPAKRKAPLVILTCLDCRGYRAIEHESGAKGSTCPRCGGDRMLSTTSKPTATFDGRQGIN